MSRGLLFHPVWNHLNQVQNDLNNSIDRWLYGPFHSIEGSHTPALNVWEEKDQVIVEAELAGVDQGDLEISVTGGNQLLIKGERKLAIAEKGIRHRQERKGGVFERKVTLPFLVDADKTEAKLENGVLTVTLSKHESAMPRKIPVTVS